MAERLDVVIIEKYTNSQGEEKSVFHRVGTAFPTKNGGYMVKSCAWPAAGAELMLSVPLPKDDQRGAPGPKRQGSAFGDKGGRFGGQGKQDDDEPLPF